MSKEIENGAGFAGLEPKRHPTNIKPAAPIDDTEIRWAVLDRAMHWWMQHRPMSMTHEAHLENPTINLGSQAEKELASAVAAYIKS